jgi:preprotein translocase subunit SecE
VVYRGGLENRFGRKPNGGSNPSLSASRITVNNEITKLLIWVAVIGVLFGLAWYMGYLVRVRNYWNETMQELKKCTWPTWGELKGSTALVGLAIVVLGIATFVVDTITGLALTYIKI